MAVKKRNPLAEVAEEETAAEAASPAEDESGTTVDLDDEDDDDDDGPEETEAPTPEGEQPSRAAKKKSRWQEHTRKREEAEERAARADERARLLEERLNQIQSSFQQVQPYGQPQGGGQQAPAAPPDQQLQQLHGERQSLLAEYEALPQDQQRAKLHEYQRRELELNNRIQQTNALIAMGGFDPKSIPQMVQREAMRLQIASQFPDMVNEPRKMFAWQGQWQLLVSQGHPDNMDTLKLAAEKAREALGISRPPAPTATAKARYSGVSRGAGGGPQAAPPKQVTLTKDDMRMARSLYPKLSPKVAYKKFALEVKLAKD